MAIYKIQLKAGKAGKGTAHFNYIMRLDPKSKMREDLVQIEDSGLNELEYPNGYQQNYNFDIMGFDPVEFWKMTGDESIVGKGDCSYKEFELTLPKELTAEQNLELAQKFCQQRFGDKYLYSISLHMPKINTQMIDDPEKIKELEEKEDKNMHCHVMFSMKEIQPEHIEKKLTMEQFLQRVRTATKKIDGVLTTGVTVSGYVKKNAAMVSDRGIQNGVDENGKPTYDISFLKESRKMWEVVLNEKLKANGIEEVSCLSLKEQKKIALETAKKALEEKNFDLANEEFAKAELVDRPAINLNMRHYQQDIKDMSDSDKERINQYKVAKEIKANKEKEYKERKNTIIPEDILEGLLGRYETEIKRAKESIPTQEDIQAQVLNKVSAGEYYRIRNQLKKLKGKQQIANINKALEVLRDQHIETKAFKNLYTRISNNYNKEYKKLSNEKEELKTMLTNYNTLKEQLKIDPNNKELQKEVSEINTSLYNLDIYKKWYESDIKEVLKDKLYEDLPKNPTIGDVDYYLKDPKWLQTVSNEVKKVEYAKSPEIKTFLKTDKNGKPFDRVSDIVGKAAKQFSVDFEMGKIEELETGYSL